MLVTRCTKPPNRAISIEGHAIEQVSCFKLLGVTITQDLSWSHHIRDVCSRSRKLCGFLYRNFSLAGPHCLNHLYKALVLPILDYSSSIWDPHQKCHVTLLERAQNFAARLVSNDWTGSPTASKARLGWQALTQRRLAQKICLCRRIISGSSLLPADTFKPHPRPCSNHKNSSPLYRPFVRTTHHRHHFTVDVVDKWNNIPQEVASAPSATSFKLRLKKLLYV